MSLDELTQTSRPDLVRGRPCVVVVAAAPIDERLRLCLESIRTHTARDVPIVVACVGPVQAVAELLEQCALGDRQIWLARSLTGTHDNSVRNPSAVVADAASMLAPCDVALIREPCRVGPGWLERLGEAAYADSNTATASALVDVGSPLAVADSGQSPAEHAVLAAKVAEQTLRLRPRLTFAVGPCIYLRRDALELVGALDRELDLRWAVDVDFAQRCLLTGLAHVAADDVVVASLLARSPDGDPAAESELPPSLRARYPYLTDASRVAASGVLPRALEAARRPRPRLWVTIDARALSASLTGTQRHILELIRALAATERLRLRLVLAHDTSQEIVELLRSMPQTELLPFDSIDDSTPRSTVFHRPQQVFGPPDVRLALRLGEHIVLNQLDLIAYRNPGYHANATAWRSHRRASRQALAAADRVVAFSDHTRMELLGDELIEDERVSIISPGLDHSAEAKLVRPEALTSFLASAAREGETTGFPEGSDREFLLCLGTDFRHKNRLFALRMLDELRRRHGWRGCLVLAGTHIPYGSSLGIERDFLERVPQLQSHVFDLGVVAEGEKLWLISNASAVVYPSVYEGFGLVPFEAGLNGTPCLFAARSSLAEVLPEGSAAIVPWSVSESADQAHALLTDAAARARHVEELARSARRLTWTATAAAMVELYNEAAIAPGREAAKLSRDEVVREQELRELVAAQDALVAQLATERDHARRMYDSLHAEVGSGLSLIGPNGALPEDLQNALLALSARPAVSRPVYGAAAKAFRAVRAIGRRTRS